MQITVLTWVRFLFCVGFNMHYQITSFTETFITKIYWKRFLFSMGFSYVIRVLSTSSLTTLNTWIRSKRFLSRVNFYRFETHVTLITLVRFLPFVGSNMHYQLTFFVETIATIISWIRFHSSMGCPMCYKVTPFKINLLHWMHE